MPSEERQTRRLRAWAAAPTGDLVSVRYDSRDASWQHSPCGTARFSQARTFLHHTKGLNCRPSQSTLVACSRSILAAGNVTLRERGGESAPVRERHMAIVGSLLASSEEHSSSGAFWSQLASSRWIPVPGGTNSRASPSDSARDRVT